MKWFYIDRIPVKRRARVSANGHVYKDKNTEADMRAVAEAYRGPLLSCPVRLTVEVFRPLPKKTPKRVESEPFGQKPDVDNVLKAVMDGLNGVAYTDDRQVIEAHIRKDDRTRDFDYEWCAFCVEPFE